MPAPEGWDLPRIPRRCHTEHFPQSHFCCRYFQFPFFPSPQNAPSLLWIAASIPGKERWDSLCQNVWDKSSPLLPALKLWEVEQLLKQHWSAPQHSQEHPGREGRGSFISLRHPKRSQSAAGIPNPCGNNPVIPAHGRPRRTQRGTHEAGKFPLFQMEQKSRQGTARAAAPGREIPGRDPGTAREVRRDATDSSSN